MKQITALLYFLSVAMLASAKTFITNATTEMLVNPIGIDIPRPRLSWQLTADRNNLVQKSYRILAATDASLLSEGKADLWDSGIVSSDRQHYIDYGGKPLDSRQRVYWKVMVVTNQGKAESQPQYFEIGLLHDSDWKGQWIGDVAPEKAEGIFIKGDGSKGFDVSFYNNRDLAGKAVATTSAPQLDYSWGGSPEEGVVADGFSTRATARLVAPKTANILLTVSGDDGYRMMLDGKEACADWGSHGVTSRSYLLKAVEGQTYDIEIQHFNDTHQSALRCEAYYVQGDSYDIMTGNTKVRARYMKKVFDIDDEVKSAKLYICGLGLYEAHINGNRVGSSVLVPGPTDYTKSVLYNTYDVTSMVTKGRGEINVTLGNGRFVSMRIPGIVHYGMPQLLCQLEVVTKSGRRITVASDTSWDITSQGAIGYNSEYDGEDFSLLRHQNTQGWHKAVRVEAPKGKLCAQTNPGLEVMESVKPVSISEIRPGVYIMDMGQNLVGNLKVRLQGNEGDTLSMHFAETLKDDGTLYTANLRSAETTDRIFLAGARAEAFTWQPSFTYHGFRYVELTGFSQKPTLDMFEGQVIYDRMATTGKWESSDNVLNRVYKNAYWGIRGNYRGMPTDCPQRDERMGWLGDRAVGCYGEAYVFDNHLLYAKWMNDIEESQLEDGQVPGVAPAYWLVYNDDVTWPAAFITGTNMIYDQYGDDRPIKLHYDAMKKFMMHIHDKNMKDGIVLKDCYGDWCVPPEKPNLIHSNDPARKTDGQLLSTAFYYHLSQLMAKFARIAGHTADTTFWKSEQQRVLTAFNDRFLDREKGCYSNNTVTANIIPWRLGMTPEDCKAKVAQHFISKSETDLNSHVSTGLIGIQQLMRGLTDAGRGDLALKIASNTTYPSWGYMAEHGATTIWELWNGDTADPAMNSGNHVMLLGDLLIWMYDYLGGIGQYTEKCDAGFKVVQLRPRIIDGLEYVNSSYDSVYGTIVSNWKKKDGRLYWHVEIPAGTSARVYLPFADSKTASMMKKKYKATPLQRQKDGSNGYCFMSGIYDIELPL